MPYIELRELSRKNDGEITYDSPSELLQLLRYIYREDKTMEDSVRKKNFSYDGPYCGCEPFLFPREYEKDYEAVFEMMMFTVNSFPPRNAVSLARHRIVSFPASDYLLPQDLDTLGRKIVLFYSADGHTAAYGVHADKENVHIHIAVCNISFRNGNQFNIGFEYNHLSSICRQFTDGFEKNVLSNPKAMKKKEEILFGRAAYTSEVGLSAAEQIRINSSTQTGF